MKFLLLSCDLRLDNVNQIVDEVGEVASLFGNFNAPAFNSAHVENIIYQAEQMIA